MALTPASQMAGFSSGKAMAVGGLISLSLVLRGTILSSCVDSVFRRKIVYSSDCLILCERNSEFVQKICDGVELKCFRRGLFQFFL